MASNAFCRFCGYIVGYWIDQEKGMIRPSNLVFVTEDSVRISCANCGSHLFSKKDFRDEPRGKERV